MLYLVTIKSKFRFFSMNMIKIIWGNSHFDNQIAGFVVILQSATNPKITVWCILAIKRLNYFDITMFNSIIINMAVLRKLRGGAVRCFSPRCHVMPKWAHFPWKTVEWPSHLCWIWSHYFIIYPQPHKHNSVGWAWPWVGA